MGEIHLGFFVTRLQIVQHGLVKQKLSHFSTLLVLATAGAKQSRDQGRIFVWEWALEIWNETTGPESHLSVLRCNEINQINITKAKNISVSISINWNSFIFNVRPHAYIKVMKDNDNDKPLTIYISGTDKKNDMEPQTCSQSPYYTCFLVSLFFICYWIKSYLI